MKQVKKSIKKTATKKAAKKTTKKETPVEKVFNYVHLVQKNSKGKIIKNESYTVHEFVTEALLRTEDTLSVPKVTFMDFIRGNVKQRLKTVIVLERAQARLDLFINIVKMIHNDKVGKSKRK